MDDASFCVQRQLNQLLNIPLPRYNNLATGNNPYLTHQYRPFDLNMRRKAEILKYSSNKMSSQTNNLTKKQQYTLLATGAIPSLPAACPNPGILLTPTSASNVPGPIIDLYNDPSVPLYNYATGNKSYAFNIPNVAALWIPTIEKDIVFTSGLESKLFYLSITSNIDQPNYTYSFSFPAGLQVRGTGDASGHIYTASIQSVALNIYYNGGGVIYSATNTQERHLTYRGMVTGQPFSATAYVGDFVFEHIVLPTQNGYAYTFSLTFTVGNSGLATVIPIGNISPTNTANNNAQIVTFVTTANPGFIFRGS